MFIEFTEWVFLESIGDPTWASLSRAVFWVISKESLPRGDYFLNCKTPESQEITAWLKGGYEKKDIVCY
jgi:hypothetical protein